MFSSLRLAMAPSSDEFSLDSDDDFEAALANASDNFTSSKRKQDVKIHLIWICEPSRVYSSSKVRKSRTTIYPLFVQSLGRKLSMKWQHNSMVARDCDRQACSM